MKTKVASVSDISESKPFCVKNGETSLLLGRKNGHIYAIENKCPHFGLPMGKGSIEGGQIVCPFHGSRFDLETGENTDWVAALGGKVALPKWSRGLLSMGKKPAPVKTFAVEIDNDDVFVDL